MDSIKKSGMCKRCKTVTTATLRRKLAENGAESFCWTCDVCDRYDPFGSGGPFIAKEVVYGYLSEAQIDKLPITRESYIHRCVVCKARDAELHHWMPRAILGDECDDWPQDYLCTSCHAKWHQLVTPQLVNN